MKSAKEWAAEVVVDADDAPERGTAETETCWPRVPFHIGRDTRRHDRARHRACQCELDCKPRAPHATCKVRRA